MFLDSLFNNDKVKSMAFGMIKKTMIQEAYKYIVLELIDGEIDIKTFLESGAPVIIEAAQLAQVEKMGAEMAEKLDTIQKESETLAQIAEEQARRIAELNQEKAELVAALEIAQDALTGRVPETPAPGPMPELDFKALNPDEHASS